MNRILYFLLLVIIASCSGFKEKAGLVKYQPDEYQVITNPPLSMPPDFNVYSPEELLAKKAKQANSYNEKLSKGENSILQNLKQ
jgi:hypothetical protein